MNDKIEITLIERGNQYGDVGLQSAVFTEIMDAMGKTGRVSSMPPVVRQSLCMIALKMSRIVCGDPMDPDSWLDIAGYAKLPHRNSSD